MEVQEWRRGGDVVRKRAAVASWGADAEKLMHVMMGQFAAGDREVTLDLLGGTTSGGRGEDQFNLEVEVDREPMPSGWEKCLDLKTGELYFESKSMGMRTSEDPRKQQQPHQHQQHQGVIAPRTPARPAHEFLASKKEETLRASTSTSGSSGEDHHAVAAAPALAPGRRLWNNLQVDDRSPAAPPVCPNSDPESNLELNLNLSPSPSTPTVAHTPQAVCTMEMVQQALRRTEKAVGKRAEASRSTSLSSWSRSSPSTSSSSTSKSDATLAPRVSYEAESSGAVELVMGKCVCCSMMVMVHKKDPKCPGCESLEVGFVSFGASAKRQRVEATV